jgi:hypothetical protein
MKKVCYFLLKGFGTEKQNRKTNPSNKLADSRPIMKHGRKHQGRQGTRRG